MWLDLWDLWVKSVSPTPTPYTTWVGVVFSVAGNTMPGAPGWFLQCCIPGKEGDDAPALPGNSWGKAMI